MEILLRFRIQYQIYVIEEDRKKTHFDCNLYNNTANKSYNQVTQIFCKHILIIDK